MEKSTKKNNNYIFLDDILSFKGGYIIIGSTLFEINSKGNVENSWALSSETLTHAEQAKEAREVAELNERTQIIIDADCAYDEDIVLDEQRLISAFDAYSKMDEEDQFDLDSLLEHFF